MADEHQWLRVATAGAAAQSAAQKRHKTGEQSRIGTQSYTDGLGHNANGRPTSDRDDQR